MSVLRSNWSQLRVFHVSFASLTLEPLIYMNLINYEIFLKDSFRKKLCCVSELADAVREIIVDIAFVKEIYKCRSSFFSFFLKCRSYWKLKQKIEAWPVMWLWSWHVPVLQNLLWLAKLGWNSYCIGFSFVRESSILFCLSYKSIKYSIMQNILFPNIAYKKV